MSFLVRFTPNSLTTAKYDETLVQIKASGEFPPEGMEFHVCFGSDGDLRVSEIWESREQFEAFGERLMPILTAAGIEFSGPPEELPVHNLVRGDVSVPVQS